MHKGVRITIALLLAGCGSNLASSEDAAAGQTDGSGPIGYDAGGNGGADAHGASDSGRNSAADAHGASDSGGTARADAAAAQADGCTPENDSQMCARLGKQCGIVTAPDNCGSTNTANCGSCPTGETCSPDNRCVCQPEVEAQVCTRLGKQCGPVSAADNCGATRALDCGLCRTDQTCTASNLCVCAPESDAELCSKASRACGSLQVTDRCGAVKTIDCGGCPANASCNEVGKCKCNANAVPDQAGTGCLLVGMGGGTCGSVTRIGYCTNSNSLWVYCDPRWGISTASCGFPGGCVSYANGEGACSCGATGTAWPSVGSDGVCAVSGNANVDDLLWTCWNGKVVSQNCLAETGKSTAQCATFVTAFGYLPLCFCSQCQQWDGTTDQCKPLCPGMTCNFHSAGSYYTCD
ncbi:MAG: hypothetical protein QM765_28905 [Myxococcales bacterium]